jgi:hypothetical protein
MIVSLRWALAALLLLAFVACEKPREEVCEDLDAVVRARALQYPTSCEADEQCVVVRVHAGLSVATSQPASDAQLPALVQRHDELCAPFAADRTVYQAVCVEERCDLLVTGELPEPDAGDDASDAPDTTEPDVSEPDVVEPDVSEPDVSEPDVDPGCGCATDEDCPVTASCRDACTCEPWCASACGNLQGCGRLEELGLGTSFQNCVERCDDLLGDGEQEVLGIVQCLARSACERLDECL